jgi:hypothetical protein
VRRRIVVLVALALVMAAVMASSALPAWAVPISEMSCAQIGEAAENTALEYADATLSGNEIRANNLSERLEALDRAAQRKGCGGFDRGGSVYVEITS